MNQIPDNAAEYVLGSIRETLDLAADGKLAEAETVIRGLVEQYPEASIVHSYMAWIQSQAGKHREALEHGRVGVRLSPDSELSSIMLFRVLWSAGEHQQAFEEMKRLETHGSSEQYAQLMEEWSKGRAEDGAAERSGEA